MMLGPVTPQSPFGPPISNAPVGLTRYLTLPLMRFLGSTGLITSSITASESFLWSMFGACCVDRTTVSTASGLPTQHADRKSTRLNSSHVRISYAVFCLKKKTIARQQIRTSLYNDEAPKHEISLPDLLIHPW